jgi:hypothetical protein
MSALTPVAADPGGCWMGLQVDFELEKVRREIGSHLKAIQRLPAAG